MLYNYLAFTSLIAIQARKCIYIYFFSIHSVLCFLLFVASFFLFLFRWSLSSIASNSTVIVEESPPPAESPGIQRWVELDDMVRRLELPTGTLQSYVQSLLRRNHTSTSSTDSDLTHANTRSSRGVQKPKHFYKFWIWPMKHYVKIHFDRLSLLAALDR